MRHIKFQAPGPRGSEKDFLNDFLCISMVRTWDPIARGHIGSWDLYSNKLGKRLPGDALYFISSTCAMRFCSRKLFNIFLCISMVRTYGPLPGAILNPGTFV